MSKITIESVIDFNNGTMTWADMTQPFSAYNDVTWRELDVQNYSWQNCPWTWDEATKTWDTAGAYAYTLTVEEDVGLAEDGLPKTFKRALKETILFADKKRFAIKVLKVDKFTSADKLNFGLKLFFDGEVMSITDGKRFAIGRGFKERIISNSLFLKNASYERGVSERTKLSDIQKKSIALVRKDNASIKDVNGKATEKVFEQSCGVNELKRTFSVFGYVRETFGASETYWDNTSFCINNAETFTISESDSRQKVFNRTLDDYVWFAEKLSRNIKNVLYDGFSFKDLLKRSTHYQYKVTDGFNIGDFGWRKTGLAFKDTFGTGENFDQPRLAKGFYENLGLTDMFKAELNLFDKESFKLVEGFSKDVAYARSFNEGFRAVEQLDKYVVSTLKETLKAADLPIKSFDRDFADGFRVIDSSWNIIEGNFKDEFGVGEEENKKIIHLMDDDFLIGDGNNNDVEIGLSDKFILSDFIDNKLNILLSAELFLSDHQEFALDISKDEAFGIDSQHSNNIGYVGLEFFKTVDDENKFISQDLFDGVLLADLPANNVEKFAEENKFGISDEFGRNAKFIIEPIDFITTKDNLYRNIKHSLVDEVYASDVLLREALYYREPREKFSVAETYWDNILFYLNILESCVFEDTLTKKVLHSEQVSFVLLDLLKKQNYLRLQEIAFDLLDAYTKQSIFNRKPDEKINMQDKKLGSKIGRNISEALPFREVLGKLFKRATEDELFEFKDSFGTANHYLRKPVEQLSIAELKCNKRIKYVGIEHLPVKERPANLFDRGLEIEMFSVSDAGKYSVLYNRKSEDVFGVSDKKLGSVVGKTNIEPIAAKEILSNLLHIPVKELLVCGDEIGRQVIFVAIIKEALNVIEKQAKAIAVTKGELLDTKDTISNLFEQFTPEGLVFADGLVREFIARRILEENVTVEDYLLKGVGCLMSEELNTYDTLIKACDGILSNISITEGELTLENFLEIVDKPPNYTKFIEFKVGEYEYKDALVRLTMKTKVKQVQPVASNVVMHVDIPDTDDRGEVEITDTTLPTRVYFNKFYYNPPEVNVTLKAGNSADGILIPNIVSTEGIDDHGRYFEVEIWDENWANRKTGKLGWVSKGY